MDLTAYLDGKIIGSIRIFSIGGGNIKIKGEEKIKASLVKMYKESSTKQILEMCRNKHMSLVDYVRTNENEAF
jgi:L-serine dehydratase